MNEIFNPMDAALTVQTRLQALLGKFGQQRVLRDNGSIRVSRVQDCGSGRLLRFETDVQADGVPYTVSFGIGMTEDGLIHANFDALAATFFAEIGRFLARVPELAQQRRRLRAQVDQAIALAAESGLDLELLSITWTNFDLSLTLGWEVAIARYGRRDGEILFDVFRDRVDGGDIDGFASNFTQGGLQEQLRLAQQLGPVMIAAEDR